MLGNQLVNTLCDCLCKLLGVRAILLQQLCQNRIVYLLMNSEILGIAVNIVGHIYHHVGENLYILLFCLNINERHCCILNGVCKLCCYLISCGSKNLSGSRLNYICSKNLMSDSVSKCQFLVEFISADLSQIVSTGVKEHCINKTFGTFYTQGLAGTNLFVQLKQTLLIILSSVLRKACFNLGFFSKKLTNLVICTDSQRTNQNGNRNLTGSVHTHIKHIVGVSLILQPCATVRDNGT